MFGVLWKNEEDVCFWWYENIGFYFGGYDGELSVLFKYSRIKVRITASSRNTEIDIKKSHIFKAIWRGRKILKYYLFFTYFLFAYSLDKQHCKKYKVTPKSLYMLSFSPYSV